MLSIKIGRDSNNKLYEEQLCALPHLYVSYSEPRHLIDLFNNTINSLSNQPGAQPYLLLSTIGKSIDLPQLSDFDKNVFLEIYNDGTGVINQRKEFFAKLLNTMNKRIRLLKLENSENINDYNTKTDKRKLKQIVVFIDDVYSLLLPSKINSALYLVKLLLAGSKTGIHCIIASTSSYKYLINQILNVNPKANKQLNEFITSNKLKSLPPLAAELIITPENFIFYKGQGKMEYERFYAL